MVSEKISSFSLSLLQYLLFQEHHDIRATATTFFSFFYQVVYHMISPCNSILKVV